jgi:hypothetical protein
MITLYAPEPPKPPHKCETKAYVSFDPPRVLQGAVIECRTCGRWWFADVSVKTTGSGAIYTVFWRKVRWYDFYLKKKVREA